MKKNTLTIKKWHRIRAQNEYRRVHGEGTPNEGTPNTERLLHRKSNYHNKCVEIWQGGEKKTAICTQPSVIPPSNLCFWESSEKTTNFFDEIRKDFNLSMTQPNVSFVRQSKTKPLAMPRISRYWDFSKIDNISMASAVVLAAEYDRLKHFLNEVPPTINLRLWKPTVVERLHKLGYFSILGHEPDPQLLVEDENVQLMRIIRSENTGKFQIVDESLSELGSFLSTDPAVLDEKIIHCLTIIGEVMSNVTQHAYQPSPDLTPNHLNSFWISAEANKTENTLRIVLYDQGATIPITYPRMNLTDSVLKYFRRTLKGSPSFDYENDGTYIRAAFKYGGSRTDKDYRGKGFPQMNQLLAALGRGELKVRSRGGWCIRALNGKITSGSLSSSIGGTLVEWKVEL